MTYGDCVAYLYPISEGCRHVSDEGKTKLTADNRIQNITQVMLTGRTSAAFHSSHEGAFVSNMPKPVAMPSS